MKVFSIKHFSYKQYFRSEVLLHCYVATSVVPKQQFSVVFLWLRLLKKAHKCYPRQKLAEYQFNMGEWESPTATLDGQNMLVVSFQDLKLKQFIPTCSTTLTGNPQKTKHHGDMPRQQAAEFYLTHTASIDIHNHVRKEPLGLEDVLQTRSPQQNNLPESTGFLFIDVYIAYKYFNSGDLLHTKLKMTLIEWLVHYQDITGKPAKAIIVECACSQVQHVSSCKFGSSKTMLLLATWFYYK